MMPPKSRSKSASSWHRCESCRAVFSRKDITLHQNGGCPPPEQDWNHGFIKKKVIFSRLDEADLAALKYTSPEDTIDILWVSSAVLKMCGMCIGEPVVVDVLGVFAVKSVWPIAEKSLSHVLMPKEDISHLTDRCNAPITIRKLPHPFPPACEIVVDLLSEDSIVRSNVTDILLVLHNLYFGKYIKTGSILHVPHYGRKLNFKVHSITNIPKTTATSEATPVFVDAVTESFQQLSFRETKGEVKAYCSTPVQSKPVQSCQEVEESFSFSSQPSSFLVDSCHQGATPIRKPFRKMAEDSYADDTLDESSAELLLSTCSVLDSHFEGVASGIQFSHVTNSSVWRLFDKKTVEKSSMIGSNSLTEIGGLDGVVEELLSVMKLALDPSLPFKSGFKVAKGALLFGPPGTGKTMLAQALALESKANVHMVQGAELFSKLLGETESKLRDFFSNALASGPAVIILDEIDSLCPKKSNISGSTELERRVVSTLSTLLDCLQTKTAFVIATTSRLDFVDPVIRRPGRLDFEVEVPVPSPDARLEILMKLLLSVPHTLSENDVKSIAQAAHGFVGADLASIVSQAGTRAFETSHKGTPLNINFEHMGWALSRVHPSAMREVLIDVPNVRWSDIGGQEDLKLKLQQAVEWPLTHPEAFKRLGISPPKGVLMFGPPGCSKTMVAKALATESKLNFLSIKGPELFSKWVGESERAVRELFRKARLVAPSIIFFDEIDALSGARGTGGSGGGSNVQERVLAQLLTEMDGVTTLENVVIVAATNRPDRIDKALLRPGRLDRIIYVPLPDRSSRKQIFDLQLHKMPISKEVDVDQLVNNTDGYSGAEILAICHEAALKALEEDISSQSILKKHFLQALTIVTPRTPPSLLKLYEEYLNT